jgi:hypothetical protein
VQRDRQPACGELLDVFFVRVDVGDFIAGVDEKRRREVVLEEFALVVSAAFAPQAWKRRASSATAA